MKGPFTPKQVRSAHAGEDDWVVMDATGSVVAVAVGVDPEARAKLIALALNRLPKARV